MPRFIYISCYNESEWYFFHSRSFTGKISYLILYIHRLPFIVHFVLNLRKLDFFFFFLRNVYWNRSPTVFRNNFWFFTSFVLLLCLNKLIFSSSLSALSRLFIALFIFFFFVIFNKFQRLEMFLLFFLFYLFVFDCYNAASLQIAFGTISSIILPNDYNFWLLGTLFCFLNQYYHRTFYRIEEWICKTWRNLF